MVECPYGEYIFTPSLFFINPDMGVENCLRILYPHFVFINETPEEANQRLQDQ